MDTLLAGLLKLSRTMRTELEIEEINMNSLLSDVVKMLDFQIKDSGAVVEVSDLPLCYGDEVQLNQVFSNLIGNALKCLDPGRPGVIKVSGRNDDGQIIYCVEDNGIGISAENQEKVFAIFNKVDSEKDGEGLGLTIIRKILERHGGKIWVESEEGKGSRFYAQLPLITG
jgi:signal transduction histidine kinase